MNNCEVFTDEQQQLLQDFLDLTKRLEDKKISSAYLLYLLSRATDDNNQNIYTKTNKVLLRDTLPKKKRLYLDWISRNFSTSSQSS